MYIKSKGIALYYAIMVTMIVSLAVILMSSIVARSLKVSRFDIEGYQAYYAADSGLSCARFWDNYDNTAVIKNHRPVFKCLTVSIVDGNEMTNPLDNSPKKCRASILTNDNPVFSDGAVPCGDWDSGAPGFKPVLYADDFNGTPLTSHIYFIFPITGSGKGEYLSCAIVKVENANDIISKFTAYGSNICNITSPRTAIPNSLYRAVKMIKQE